jgi:hypothetical protein
MTHDRSKPLCDCTDEELHEELALRESWRVGAQARRAVRDRIQGAIGYGEEWVALDPLRGDEPPELFDQAVRELLDLKFIEVDDHGLARRPPAARESPRGSARQLRRG